MTTDDAHEMEGARVAARARAQARMGARQERAGAVSRSPGGAREEGPRSAPAARCRSVHSGRDGRARGGVGAAVTRPAHAALQTAPRLARDALVSRATQRNAVLASALARLSAASPARHASCASPPLSPWVARLALSQRPGRGVKTKWHRAARRPAPQRRHVRCKR
eukprot:256117-Chlamydomonas_euryale.AAC.5